MRQITTIVRSLFIRIATLRPTTIILGAMFLIGVTIYQLIGVETAIKARSLRASQGSVLHQVENHVGSVQVIAADLFGEADTPSLRLVLKNISPNKRLTAFAVSFGDPDGWIEREYLFSENAHDVYPPGAIITDKYDGVGRNGRISILCAIFEGGTFEGNALQASNILNKRFGQRLFFSKALPEITNIQAPLEQEELDARITSAIDTVRKFGKPTKQELEKYLPELVQPPGNLDTIEAQVGRGFEMSKQYFAQRIERVRGRRLEQGRVALANGRGIVAFPTRLDAFVDRIKQMRDAQ